MAESRSDGRTLRVLMELRPCFDGYAGIPQETRLLFGMFARMAGIEAGGLLNGSSSVDARAPNRHQQLGDRVIRQAQHLIALDTGDERKRLIARLTGSNSDGEFGRRMKLLGKLGQGDQLGAELDPELFEDWLWMRLFRLGLPPEDRALLQRARYPLPRMSWGDAARLAVLGGQARARLDLRAGHWDVYLAHTPSPYRVRGGQAIIRYHDAVPILWPHTISNAYAHSRGHYKMLKANVAEGAMFVCTSEPVRNDLLRFFPEAEKRCVTIPTMSSGAFRPERRTPAQIKSIIERGRTAAARRLRDMDLADTGNAPGDRKGGGAGVADLPFILTVSTMEPRKNYGMLMRAAATAARGGARFRLVMIANPGWRSEKEVELLKQLVAEDIVYHLVDLSTSDLRALYGAAHAVVCPSRAEGFDLATVEAMACAAPLLASDIPVHRWVCGDGADYFDPYDEDELAALITSVVAAPRESGGLAALADRGRRRSLLYTPEVLKQRWEDLLQRVRPA